MDALPSQNPNDGVSQFDTRLKDVTMEARFFARNNLSQLFIAQRLTQILGYDQKTYPIQKDSGYKWDVGGNSWWFDSVESLDRKPSTEEKPKCVQEQPDKYVEYVIDYRYGNESDMRNLAQSITFLLD